MLTAPLTSSAPVTMTDSRGVTHEVLTSPDGTRSVTLRSSLVAMLGGTDAAVRIMLGGAR